MKPLPVVLLLLASASSTAQTFKLVRAQSGPSGTVDGSKFVLSETRSRFVYPQDKTLVVYFEWVGPIGEHVLAGHWKAPDGRVFEISADVRMRTQAPDFGAYWQYMLQEGLPNGVWTLEVRIDGEPAGSHSFEVISPELRPAPTTNQPPTHLTVEQIYSLVKPAMVWVHKIDRLGRRSDTSSGFVWAKDRIATAFQSVDSAQKLEIEFDDGRRVQTEELAGLNRLQDWAIVAVSTADVKPVQRAAATDLKIGERAVVFEVGQGKVRSIGGVDITAKHQDRLFGPRIAFSPSLSPSVTGGPLLTSRGAAAAVLGGSRTPGARIAGIDSPLWDNSAVRWQSESVPIWMLAEQPRATLAALLANGTLSPPLTHVPELVLGGTTRSLPRNPREGLPVETAEFSRMDREIIVYSAWRRSGKRSKGVMGGTVYDAGNRAIVTFTPRKISFSSPMSNLVFASFSPANLVEAPYRIDLIFEGEICWRGYFRIVD